MSPLPVLIIITLLAPYVHATVLPRGGVQRTPLEQGSSAMVRWNNDLDARHVDIGIWDGITSRLTMIATRVPASDGSYSWHIPEDFNAGDRFRFMVRDSDAPLRAEYSAGFVTIGASMKPLVSSVRYVDEARDVRAAPMPAKDQLTVSWKDRQVVRIDLIDLHWRTVGTFTVEPDMDHQAMDVRSLASGMYFVRLTHVSGNIAMTSAVISR